jgi:hypothetical protein
MPTQYEGLSYNDPTIYVCPTIAVMRLVQGQIPSPTSALSGDPQAYPVAILLGSGAAFDGIVDGVFAWDEVSTSADNGTTVIKPTAIGAGNPGRWRSIV